jgi:hypothetical protein
MSMIECAIECSADDFLQCPHFQAVLQQLATGAPPHGHANPHDCTGKPFTP